MATEDHRQANASLFQPSAKVAMSFNEQFGILLRCQVF
jgi:hypothetical protein